jgi:hypothetical protein
MATARRATVEEVEDEDAPHIVYPARKAALAPVERVVPVVVSGPTAPKVLVSRTFENYSPAKAITFLDSGASDHVFRNRSDFRSYEAVVVRTGKSALASEGDFVIVGKGTVTKVFNVGGKEVHITFANALHAPTLSANLVSVSQLDTAGCYSTFGGGGAIIREGSVGETILEGRGSAGMYVLEATTLTPISQPLNQPR